MTASQWPTSNNPTLKRATTGAMVLALLFLSLLAASCSSAIRRTYLQTREAVLAPPPAVPENWEPDVVLSIDWALLSDVVEQRIQQRLAGPAPGIGLANLIQVTPDLQVSDLRTAPSWTCPSCVKLRCTLNLKLNIQAASARTSLSVTANLAATFEIRGILQDRQLEIQAILAELSLRPKQGSWAQATGTNLQGSISRYLQAALASSPVRLAKIPWDPESIIAVRPRCTGPSLNLELLTANPAPHKVQAPRLAGAQWALAFSTDSLLALARRASFRGGALTHGVFLDLVDIDTDQDDLWLHVRLWRPRGLGWWRDYRVLMKLQVENGSIETEPLQITELGHSRHAALADPVTALSSAVVLESIREGTTLSRGIELGGSGIISGLTAENLALRDDALVIYGKVADPSPTGPI